VLNKAVLTIGIMSVSVGAAVAQDPEDPNVPRPPALLTLTRTERIEAAANLYLRSLIQAIQTADTAALSALVPDDVIPNVEKPVAQQAGCASLADAVRQLRAARAGQSSNPDLPLRMIHLVDGVTDLTAVGDTVARVSARIRERTPRELRYAPIELVLAADGDRIRVVAARGVLVGVCGFARMVP
jgi:hypothetical protein